MSLYRIRPVTGWQGPRTPEAERRSRAAFSSSWSSTVDLLRRELGRLDATNVVIQAEVSEADIRLDGELRANARPSSPAVRLLFDSKHGPLTYQCDSCEFWQHNVRSIALGLEALRAVDRYGINGVSGQQYKGYRELEGAPSTDPVAVLRRYAGPASSTIRDMARDAARRTHPDVNGGNRTAWDEVEHATQQLIKRGEL